MQLLTVAVAPEMVLTQGNERVARKILESDPFSIGNRMAFVHHAHAAAFERCDACRVEERHAGVYHADVAQA